MAGEKMSEKLGGKIWIRRKNERKIGGKILDQKKNFKNKKQ